MRSSSPGGAASGCQWSCLCVYTVTMLSWWALGAIWSNSVPATTVTTEFLHMLHCCKDCPPAAACGLSLRWLLWLPSTGSRCVGLSDCHLGSWLRLLAPGSGSVVVVLGLGRSAACGVFLDRVEPAPLLVGSLPLSHQASRVSCNLVLYISD